MPFDYKIFVCIFFSWILTSCNQKNELFESIAASRSGIDFKNSLPSNEQLNGFNFANYYNGGGVATGDINNDGLPDIYFTANSKSNNKLYLNKGNFEFEDITQSWCSW